MEFTTLATWIYRHRKIGKKLLVEHTTGESGVQLRCVNANEEGDESISYEPSRQCGRIETPDREKRIEPATRQQALAIAAHVLEKKIAERDVSHIGQLAPNFFKSGTKRRFVCVVRAARTERDLEER
jgi:hypothetical protein